VDLLFVFQIVIVILGLGVFGSWILRSRLIPSGPLGFLFNFTINVSLPSLIFASIIRRFVSFDFVDWWRLPLWFIFFSFIALALTVVTQFISRKETRHEFAISLFYQNAMFYPLVILSLMFGSSNQYIAYLVLFAFLQPTIVFSTYSLFFRRKALKPNLFRIINPVVIATFVAMAVSLIGMNNYLPEWLISVFEIIGAVSTPLLVLILLSFIYNDFKGKSDRRKQILVREIIKFVAVKNFLFPIVFLGILLIVRPEYGIALIILLQGAAPPITAVPILTERSGGNRTITDQFIIVSFVFSVVSIPLILYLFNLFFQAPH
jgi:hypothetical protein